MEKPDSGSSSIPSRRDVLKTLAVGSAYSVLGTGLPWAQARDAATLVLKNGRFTTLDAARSEGDRDR